MVAIAMYNSMYILNLLKASSNGLYAFKRLLDSKQRPESITTFRTPQPWALVAPFCTILMVQTRYVCKAESCASHAISPLYTSGKT